MVVIDGTDVAPVVLPCVYVVTATCVCCTTAVALVCHCSSRFSGFRDGPRGAVTPLSPWPSLVSENEPVTIRGIRATSVFSVVDGLPAFDAVPMDLKAAARPHLTITAGHMKVCTAGLVRCCVAVGGVHRCPLGVASLRDVCTDPGR